MLTAMRMQTHALCIAQSRRLSNKFSCTRLVLMLRHTLCHDAHHSKASRAKSHGVSSFSARTNSYWISELQTNHELDIGHVCIFLLQCRSFRAISNKRQAGVSRQILQDNLQCIQVFLCRKTARMGQHTRSSQEFCQPQWQPLRPVNHTPYTRTL